MNVCETHFFFLKLKMRLLPSSSPHHAHPANLAAHVIRDNPVGQGERADHAVQVDVGTVRDALGNPAERDGLVR